jgi:hypothetical protein
MLDPYKETCPRSLAVISRRLIEHCLPFFIDSKAPSVTLRDEIESIDLNKAFAEAFAAGATDHTFQVKDHTFRMRGLRLYSPYENLHRLMYAANSREVRTEKIDKVIPNLQSKLSDPTGPFVYLGFIEGDYLDKTANGERTDFSIPSGDDDDNVVGEITIRDIRADAVESVRRDLAPFLEEINREKEERITTYIAQEAPEYRPLVRYLPQFIDKIAPTTKGLALEIALHEQLHQRQRELKQESGKLLSESGKESRRLQDLSSEPTRSESPLSPNMSLIEESSWSSWKRAFRSIPRRENIPSKRSFTESSIQCGQHRTMFPTNSRICGLSTNG